MAGRQSHLGIRLPPPGSDARWLLDVTAGEDSALPDCAGEEQVELALRHGLIGLLANGNDQLARKLVRPVSARLQARHEVMKTHLQRLLVALHDSGVHATVLKGPVLATDAYPKPIHRTYTDVDILVPAQQVQRALSVLALDRSIPSIPPKTPKADKRNVPVVDPSGVGFTLDLHWDMFSYSQLRSCARGATDWAWSAATLEGDHALGPLWRLPTEAMIAFLSTHAVLDHRFRLILFRDLAEVARKKPDWAAVVSFAERWQLRSTTYVALLIAVEVAAAPVPEEVLRALRPSSVPVRAVERLLPTTDLVHFDGHTVHPLNLATVLLHDDRSQRRRLIAAAPLAFPGWHRRVGSNLSDLLPNMRARRRASSIPSSLILHVLPMDLARGAQTYAEALSRTLDSESSGHQTMTIFESEPVALHADIELGVRRGLGRRIGFDPLAAWRLSRELRRLQPSVVVAHGGESLKYVALTAPPAASVVYYKIGTSRLQLSNRVRKRLYRTFAQRVDVVAGVSHEMVEEAREVLGVCHDKAVYAPNGRDPEPFLPWRGSASETVRLVFVGHMTRTKRPERFISLVRALVTRGAPVEGVLVGDGPLLEEVRRHTESLPVSLLGRRDDVPEILSGSDIFVFTSLAEGEGMPGVLIEASLAGLPIVATDVPGANSVIETGVTGFVVPVDDFDALVSSTHELVTDQQLRRSMGEAGHDRSMANFTMEASVAVWRRLLSNLLDDSVTPVES